ncbi:hypothetical protein BKA70DRAFT_1241559 [Coprinopsis sp. MPI-PUGE-AT-0042]|nr:hypothetical protein BKA70DRAFT_1241559 [Coprinopsis sp. MPI-PUGE-AT-0042]
MSPPCNSLPTRKPYQDAQIHQSQIGCHALTIMGLRCAKKVPILVWLWDLVSVLILVLFYILELLRQVGYLFPHLIELLLGNLQIFSSLPKAQFLPFQCTLDLPKCRLCLSVSHPEASLHGSCVGRLRSTLCGFKLLILNVLIPKGLNVAMQEIRDLLAIVSCKRAPARKHLLGKGGIDVAPALLVEERSTRGLGIR